MNLEDENIVGRLTVDGLTALINDNDTRARLLGLKLWRKVTTKKLQTRILRGDEVLFEDEYFDDFMHVLIAKLHHDVAHFLGLIEHQNKMLLKKKDEQALKDRNATLKRTMYEQAHPEFTPDQDNEDLS